MAKVFEGTILPTANLAHTDRRATRGSDSPSKRKRGLRHKDSYGRPQPERYLKVFDCALDGSGVRDVDAKSVPKDVDFIDDLPEQKRDVIRIILDGDEVMLRDLGVEPLLTGPQCVSQPMSTYLSKCSGSTDILGNFTHGKAYYWPHLKDIVSGNRLRRWFFMDTFAYHDENCGYWKGRMSSKLRYTGSHESSEAYFTVTKDTTGRYLSEHLSKSTLVYY